MSKLEPQVGDKVTLTHEQGFVVKGRLVDRAFTGDWERWTIQNVGKFHDDEGWSVTEIHERPKPEPGTFIKGVDVDGDQFVGIVGGELNEHRVVGGFWAAYGYGGTNTWGWEDIREWEVIS